VDTRIDIRITEVFFNGDEPRYEGYEYVEIANCGDRSQDMEGWVLLDVDDGGPIFVFPTFTLHPEFIVRVYTDEVHPAYGGLTFGNGAAIWNNTRPDLAELRDSNGVVVGRRGYKAWTGCD
jgi:hypothetical protein